MSASGSITLLLERFRAGDRTALHPLWDAYFRRLVGLASKKLGNFQHGAFDKEDIALSAFNAFCTRIESGASPQIRDRHGLWQMLALLTTRKAMNRIKSELRQKRDVRKNLSSSEGVDPENVDVLYIEALGREPDPAQAVEVADSMRHLLDSLANEEFKTIALKKLEGFTNQQIAQQLGRSLATVERRLDVIRARWQTVLNEVD